MVHRSPRETGGVRDAALHIAPSLRLRGQIARAAAVELQIVRRANAASSSRLIRIAVASVNRLGNGWIYFLVGIAVIAWARPAPSRVIAAAAVAALVSHLIYAVAKRRIKRLRPFERDPSILPIARVLDRYSFPSGHCMTVVAVAVPIVFAMPAWWPLAAAALTLVAACRLVAGHHYPSDIASGALIGAAVGVAVTVLAPQL